MHYARLALSLQPETNIILMSRLHAIWRQVCRRKYLLVTVVGGVLIGFVGENSVMRHVQNRMLVREMKREIEAYNAEHVQAERMLHELKRNPKAITKIARERYFMKADDEDIFVLSDDDNTENAKDETTE